MASRPQFVTPDQRPDKRPDKRREPRMMCSQLVGVKWKDTGAHRQAGGVRQECLAVLEDISASGACVQMERPLEIDTSVKVAYGGGHLAGKVRYCVFSLDRLFRGYRIRPRRSLVTRSIPPHPSCRRERTAGSKPSAQAAARCPENRFPPLVESRPGASRFSLIVALEWT
jgi:hypothetical protein